MCEFVIESVSVYVLYDMDRQYSIELAVSFTKKNEKEKKKGGEVTDSEEGEGKEGSSWKRRLKMPYKIC